MQNSDSAIVSQVLIHTDVLELYRRRAWEQGANEFYNGRMVVSTALPSLGPRTLLIDATPANMTCFDSGSQWDSPEDVGGEYGIHSHPIIEHPTDGNWPNIPSGGDYGTHIANNRLHFGNPDKRNTADFIVTPIGCWSIRATAATFRYGEQCIQTGVVASWDEYADFAGERIYEAGEARLRGELYRRLGYRRTLPAVGGMTYVEHSNAIKAPPKMSHILAYIQAVETTPFGFKMDFYAFPPRPVALPDDFVTFDLDPNSSRRHLACALRS